MFSKNKLLKRTDFDDVFRKGKVFSSNFLFIKIKKNNLTYSRVGFSIGIAFSKKAVERNRLKRQLREIFKKNVDQIKKGFDLVVFIKNIKKEELKFDLVVENVKKALIKAKLI